MTGFCAWVMNSFSASKEKLLFGWHCIIFLELLPLPGKHQKTMLQRVKMRTVPAPERKRSYPDQKKKNLILYKKYFMNIDFNIQILTACCFL